LFFAVIVQDIYTYVQLLFYMINFVIIVVENHLALRVFTDGFVERIRRNIKRFYSMIMCMAVSTRMSVNKQTLENTASWSEMCLSTLGRHLKQLGIDDQGGTHSYIRA
jgi:hypothetical protein